MQTIHFPNGHMLVNNVEIDGFGSDDDVFKFERLAESITYKVGAGGNAVLNISADKSAKITIKLQPTSPSNAYLMGLLALEEGGADTFVPVAVTYQDTARQDIVTAIPGCLIKVPDFERGMDSSGNDVQWEFFFERGDVLWGNPAFVQFATAAQGA
jgi:hypothetical protein